MAPSVVKLSINNRPYEVSPESLPGSYKLVDFVRDHALLKGTKSMCREGGCGICTVTVKRPSCKTEEPVNSCLVPIHACDGWQVTTIEALGNSDTGYNKIQENLADHNGSQCGYCSPGMVMTMYGASKQLPNEVKDNLEGCFDGNICRCTGYRQIMHAMQQCVDIEDLTKCHNCPHKEVHSSTSVTLSEIKSSDGSTWYQPKTLEQLKSVLAKHKDDKYYMVAGHTGEAVYKRDGPYGVYININSIPDMNSILKDSKELIFGAGINLTKMMEEITKASTSAGFEYLTDAHTYVDHVANLQVRNMGTWAGNLMMKYYHKDFPSDIFILLETVGATLAVFDCVSGAQKNDVKVAELLGMDMKGKVILNVKFSSMPGWALRTYKVMPTYRNSHTKLSLALFIKLDTEMGVSGKPSVVYAGVGADYIHAGSVEKYLMDKKLTDNTTLQECMKLLKAIKFDEGPTTPSAKYRSSLAQSLFFKAVLSLTQVKVSPEAKSGGDRLVRPEKSSGVHDFQTDPAKFPLTKPIPKLDSRKQTAGEAQFIGDIPAMKGQLHAVFFKATVGSGQIGTIDTSKAESASGVIKILTHKDIPGKNIVLGTEVLLCEKTVEYYGMPIGIVIAETQAEALAARELVKVTYTNIKKPLLTIEDAILNDSHFPVPDNIMGLPTAAVKGDAEAALKTSDAVIEGSVSTGEQYGMHTETQNCTAIPEEGYYTLYASTQVMTGTLNSAAQVLGINANMIEVKVRRLGGGFGAKQSRSRIPAASAALAAYHTRKPVTMCLTLEDNMEILGRRMPTRFDYKVGVDKKTKKIQAITGTIYENSGWNTNDAVIVFMGRWLDNAYFVPNWNVRPVACKTNQPNHSAVRAPSMLAALHLCEQMIESVASGSGIPAIELREANFYTEGQIGPYYDVVSPCLTQEIWTSAKTKFEYEKRAAVVEQYNKVNLWRKKGISLVPLRFGYAYWPNTSYMVHVTVNYGDASVIVVHGGVEIGQGINTKVIQMAAHTLGIPMEQVSVHPTTTTFNINCGPTGGSVTSDMNCLGVKEACQTLLKAMEPHKEEGMSWKEVVQKCEAAQVDLHAKKYLTNLEACPFPTTGGIWEADVFGAACAEVELDVLTGNYIIHRMDIIYDCGVSFSPEIDVGQIEGAIVMGLGHFLMEEYKYDPDSGQALTVNTWEYKVPYGRDIPVDLRTTLLNHPNKRFALGSKVVGEPPLLLAESGLVALQNCIAAFRKQQNKQNLYVTGDAPFTVERVTLGLDIDTSKFVV